MALTGPRPVHRRHAGGAVVLIAGLGGALAQPVGAPAADALPVSRVRIELQVAGRAGIPADAAVVVLNVTATNELDAGYVTVWPCDEPQPIASNLNYRRHEDIANVVLSRIGRDGTVCLEASADADLLADVSGYFPAGSLYTAIPAPTRLLDTRSDLGADAVQQLPGGIVRLRVGGRAGIPADAPAAAMNVTAVAGATTGYVTVFPCDGPPPNTSNVNFSPGRDIANLVVSRLDDGDVCVYSSSDVELVVDAEGFMPTDRTYVPTASPARLLDTRSGNGALPGRVPSDGTVAVQIAGRGGVPADAAAVAVTVTVAGTEADGFVTVWPCGPRPDVSSLNFVEGDDRANLVIAPLAADGRLCLFASASTHLVADIAGFFPATSDYRPVPEATRLLDTRSAPGVAPLRPVPGDRRPQVMFVGDSIGLYLGERAAQQAGVLGVTVQNRSVGACPLADVRIRRRNADGSILTFPDGCPQVVSSYGAAVQSGQPDVVIMAFAATMLDENEIAPGVWAAPCSAAFDAWFHDQIVESVADLSSAGATVYWATAAYYRAEVTHHTTILDDQIDCLNATAVEVAAQSGGSLGVLHLGEWTCPTRECLSERDGAVLRADGSHYRNEGASLANRWLLAQIFP